MSGIARLSREELLGLVPGSFTGRLDQEDVKAIIMACDSFWVRPKNAVPDVPHAELTAGDCSDGFVNLRIVLSYLNLCGLFARQLVDLLREHYQGKVDWVVGSHTAATGLSYAVADVLGARWYTMSKNPDGSQSIGGVSIPAGAKVLGAEELMTTSKTTIAVRNGVRANSPDAELIPFVPVIVHRPAPGECGEVDGAKVLYLAHYDVQKWKPADCPLCAGGSPRLRPNVPDNWRQLVESMKASV